MNSATVIAAFHAFSDASIWPSAKALAVVAIIVAIVTLARQIVDEWITGRRRVYVVIGQCMEDSAIHGVRLTRAGAEALIAAIRDHAKAEPPWRWYLPKAERETYNAERQAWESTFPGDGPYSLVDELEIEEYDATR